MLEFWLRVVQAFVERDGELTEKAIKSAFGDQKNSLRRDLDELRLKCLQNPEGLDAAVLRERNKQEVLAFLKEQLSSIAWHKRECETREDELEEARLAAAVLPSVEVLEKIQRYETKLERQIFRALAQLERVQRMRKGEAVPAPVLVNVSERE